MRDGCQSQINRCKSEENSACVRDQGNFRGLNALQRPCKCAWPGKHLPSSIPQRESIPESYMSRYSRPRCLYWMNRSEIIGSPTTSPSTLWKAKTDAQHRHELDPSKVMLWTFLTRHDLLACDIYMVSMSVNKLRSCILVIYLLLISLFLQATLLCFGIYFIIHYYYD